MDKSMTGDGAVVRLDEWEIPKTTMSNMAKLFKARAIEHNAIVAHALAQTAEIERLTRQVAKQSFALVAALKTPPVVQAGLSGRNEALVGAPRGSEESHKIALDAIYEAWGDQVAHMDDAVAEAEARTADLLKALERYGAHDLTCPYTCTPFVEIPCDCGLAAAKGETV